MLRVFEGVHAGSVLESEELYNSEEVYKIDSQHLLQSEEESEIKSDKLSPKEQIELDLITRTLVVILNNYSQENDFCSTSLHLLYPMRLEEFITNVEVVIVPGRILAILITLVEVPSILGQCEAWL